ncbi:IS481 family transposase [Microbacterium kyungheense]|uniref:IS30 family transposase n=2 Tax=Microbacterium kyungheense TaxID=1263636 RepID=A0A543ES85_9MICO|nr:IS481 family transposase [Microbacterium kyungheense]TQM24379.1 IS30 family transposase [Microbacterium kyungheense]TQM25079.1 IS30 family transposase [Microbacterium kyungheense]TQM27702.1 IS30 family transposase [Microbacterium kyungheense]TQM33759.1 IS30 family transposase [Microbacterium kyungheense]TQM33934.1 IS30 family transposase [Microbacterium kyungheense]
MSHANARLNVRGRVLLVERVLMQHRPVAHVAKELGVSRQCAHRWVNRFRAEGVAGLSDRSSRPHSMPRRTPLEVELRVVAVRRQLRQGPDRLAMVTGVPARTVTAILRRHHVPRLVECDPLTGAVIRASKTTAVRYERARAGELVHMDVKKLGRIPDGGGWRAHGRSAGDTAAHKKARIGFDYVHSLVDDHSRLAYSEIHPDEKGATCAAFLARAAAYFRDHGIARIERVMTDNHFSYRLSTDVRDVLTSLGAKHVLIRPHCPWQNGKVERLNRTLQTEWAYRQVFTSNDQRAAALAPWIEQYNTQRYHSAIGGTPLSRVSPT